MSWHPALDDMEHRPDGPQGHGPAPQRDNREPSTRDRLPLGSSDCWCGQPGAHPWPGKAEGRPHPR